MTSPHPRKPRAYGFRPAGAALALLGLLVLAVIAPAFGAPLAYYPFPTVRLPHAGDASQWPHPRLVIPALLPRLQEAWDSPSPTPAAALFKQWLAGLLAETSCAGKEWLCGDGMAAAGLALAWRLSGNAAYAQKACDLYLPSFTGAYTNVGGNWLSTAHFAFAFDWMYDAPCFNQAARDSLRGKLVRFSGEGDDLARNGASISHDSDMNCNLLSSHLVAGLALRGENSSDTAEAVSDLLLSRGWTLLVQGISTDPNIPEPQPLLDFYRQSVGSGAPIVGWEYGVGDDLLGFHAIMAVLDDMGISDDYFPEIRPFWANSIRSYIHYFDPAMTFWHWLGDSQDPTDISSCVGCAVQSFLSMSAHWAERFGDLTAAAHARFHMDEFLSRRSYVADSEPLLWFLRSWNSTASRLDYRRGPSTLPRTYIAGVGPGQHTGTAAFRTHWNSTSSPSDPVQATWGIVTGSGAYPWDHILNDAGNFFVWRNGEFLLTEPRSYQGPEVAEVFNSLSIVNPGAGNTYNNLSGGPIVYGPEGAAYVERGRSYGVTKADDDMLYVAINMDHNYNFPPNPWSECTGLCLAPVKTYSRHIAWDGGDYLFIFDRVKLQYPAAAALRFRTNSPPSPPTVVDAAKNIVQLPSSGGSYHTLMRVFNSPQLDWRFVNESETWPQFDWHLDPQAVGWMVRARLLPQDGLEHDVVTVMNFDRAGAGTGQLDSAGLVTPLDGPPGTGSFGVCAGKMCVVLAGYGVASSGGLRTNASYESPAILPGGRHAVGDLDASKCYDVLVNGTTVASSLGVADEDNTVVFAVGGGSLRVDVQAVACPDAQIKTSTTSSVTKSFTTSALGTSTMSATRSLTTSGTQGLGGHNEQADQPAAEHEPEADVQPEADDVAKEDDDKEKEDDHAEKDDDEAKDDFETADEHEEALEHPPALHDEKEQPVTM
ncbi:hypothetical protein DFJ74DRAFT_706712 [Hyaloraphidium curvatum]|nr:hypothetical protein DFJ74DRAFT_706712 [Hyaloraphidium curvatum]